MGRVLFNLGFGGLGFGVYNLTGLCYQPLGISRRDPQDKHRTTKCALAVCHIALAALWAEFCLTYASLFSKSFERSVERVYPPPP